MSGREVRVAPDGENEVRRGAMSFDYDKGPETKAEVMRGGRLLTGDLEGDFLFAREEAAPTLRGSARPPRATSRTCSKGSMLEGRADF